MANVLNKFSKLMLYSVNTPDFPSDEWIINPDLSLVENIPNKYWKIDELETSEDVLIAVDDNDNPIYETQTSTTYMIRPMTEEEKSQYDGENAVVIPFTGRLLDGTPAYQFNGKVISIETRFVTFSLTTKGIRNVFLDYQNQQGTINGYFIPRKALAKDITITFGAPITTDVIIRFKSVVDGTEYFSIGLQEGSQNVVINTSEVLPSTTLACFVESESNVVNPVVSISVAWCD